jgi:hypothetical protein
MTPLPTHGHINPKVISARSVESYRARFFLKTDETIATAGSALNFAVRLGVASDRNTGQKQSAKIIDSKHYRASHRERL